MPWWFLYFGLVALFVFVARGIAKRIDQVEDDSSYIYEHRQAGEYGSKFLNILLGRNTDHEGHSAD